MLLFVLEPSVSIPTCWLAFYYLGRWVGQVLQSWSGGSNLAKGQVNIKVGVEVLTYPKSILINKCSPFSPLKSTVMIRSSFLRKFLLCKCWWEMNALQPKPRLRWHWQLASHIAPDVAFGLFQRALISEIDREQMSCTIYFFVIHYNRCWMHSSGGVTKSTY